jgi:vacuolar-type H+-ATPase subunit E/Vma4
MNLEPLRRAVLEQAHADAARLRSEAAARAADLFGRADREGTAILEQARVEGAESGRLRGSRALAAAHRNARAEVLRARRDLHDELRGRARRAALEIRAEAEYPALLEALAAVARRQLGAAASLDIDPPDTGGVRAAAAGRSVDYTLAALADRCLARLGGRIEDLWT